MQRRLPVFFVMDVSESMIGEDLQNLEAGMGRIVKSLRADAHALECVHVSVLAFAGIARVLVPLTELAKFYAPRLPVGSGTALGAALILLMDEVDAHVVRRSERSRGDYKPVAYLMTDGRPTDDVEPALARWEREGFARRLTLVALAIGEGADHSVLNRLTDNLVIFDRDTAQDFDPVIRWLTMSISAHSQRLDAAATAPGKGAGVNLAKPSDGLAPWLGDVLKAARLDEQVVVVKALCAERQKPYLIRYRRAPDAARELGDDGIAHYLATGSHVASAEYQEWSGPNPTDLAPTVSTRQLRGHVGCPQCGAPFGLATCACGGVHCVRGDGPATCPHCHKTGHYGAAEADDPGADVQRGRG